MKTTSGLFSFVSRHTVLGLLAGGVLWAASARGDHTLVAHFAFDTTDSSNDALGVDSSGNGNDMTFGMGGGGGGVSATANAAAGPLAIQFSAGPNGNGVGLQSWSSPPTQLLATLAGSFTVSCWARTTQSYGSPGDYAFQGAAIVAADIPGLADDLVPIALAGGQVAFNTGGAFVDQSLNSKALVNDGVYHLLTVTRNQATGEKTIYIDGKLDSVGFGTTNLLNAPKEIDIGCLGDASDPNPNDYSYYGPYVGCLDDLQFYSGVLNSAEVAYLYNHPGAPAPNLSVPAPNFTTGPNLAARYAFTNATNIGADSSGHGYDLDYNSSAGGGGGVTFSSIGTAGAGAAYFDGGSCLSYSSLPAGIRSAFASSFTLSVWVETTNVMGNDGDWAYRDQGIVTADVPGLAKDIVPMSLTGSGVGFNTGSDPLNGPLRDDTLSSYANVTDGSFHQVVVTRDEITGIKQIYVDGVLSAQDSATTEYLYDPVEFGVGAQFDASQTNPANAAIGGFFQGWMADMQIYNRVLTPNEITFLNQNPGQVVSNAPPAPVSATLEFSIYRTQYPGVGDEYYAYPIINSISPSPGTTNLVASPSRAFIGQISASGNVAGADIMYSLDDLITELTNGSWSLVINEGATNEQNFHFQVSVSDLTSNLLEAVRIAVPADGAMDVPANTPFQWGGPSGYSSISVNNNSSNGVNSVNATLGPAATNWASAPELYPGTNLFQVIFTSNGFPGLTFTQPLDSLQSPPAGWAAAADVNTEADSQFVVSGLVLPARFGGVAPVAGGLQFSFTSQPCTTNTVQARTNLEGGSWVDVTNFTGDGNVWQFFFPATNPPVEFFRVKTQ